MTYVWVGVQTHLIDGRVDTSVPLGVWTNPNKAMRYITNRSDMDACERTSQPAGSLEEGSWPMWIWRHREDWTEVVTLSPLDAGFVQRE